SRICAEKREAGASDDPSAQMGGNLKVTLLAPEKKSNLVSTTIRLTVQTETDMVMLFAADKFSVVRTMEDFIWLGEVLEEACPTCVMPPPPRKQHAGQSVDDYFIQKRFQSLQLFVDRLTAHYVLRIHPFFRLFLEADEKELKKEKKRIAKAQSQSRR